DSQPGGAAGQGGLGHPDGTVAVGLGLDDRAELGRGGQRGQGFGVGADRAEVDLRPHRPQVHAAYPSGPLLTRARNTSPRATMPTSLPSRTTGRRRRFSSCISVATCSRVSSSRHIVGSRLMTSPTVAPTALRSWFSNFVCGVCSYRYASCIDS